MGCYDSGGGRKEGRMDRRMEEAAGAWLRSALHSIQRRRLAPVNDILVTFAGALLGTGALLKGSLRRSESLWA